MNAETREFHDYLTTMSRTAPFASAVGAVNYAVEGVAQKISEKALRGLGSNEKIGPRGRWWLEEHAKYDDEHPIHALEIIKSCVGKAEEPDCGDDRFSEESDADARVDGGLLREMSKRQRTSPAPGPRRSAAPPKGAAFDPLATAREIVAALADAVVVTGVDRRVATVNRAAAELFGRPLEDLPGTAVDDLLAVVEREHVAEREQRGYAGEEQRYETARSCGRTVSSAMSPCRPLRSCSTGSWSAPSRRLRDITEQKRAQDTLARSGVPLSQPVRVRFGRDRDARRKRSLHHVQSRGRKSSRATGARSWWRSGSPRCCPTTTCRKPWAHFQQALAGETGLFETQFLPQGWRRSDHPGDVLDAAEGRRGACASSAT